MAEYMTFAETDRSASGKTRRWLVYAKGGGQLGEVKWFARWRCYGFFSNGDTVFEATCLRDLAEFCEGVTEGHRATVRASAPPTAAPTEGKK